tara:strand:- start:8968 stop:9564 length:597 start_codon:yes stop_codon:yes gene_type:complete
MIEFKKLKNNSPYLLFKQKYDEALKAGQQNIEAIAISSFNNKIKEVDSRFVNIKFIENEEFIFFSNYESPKSIAFSSHNKISALFYWSTINVQIRMKAKIQKTSSEYNKNYFKKRSSDKNALAISSNQSKEISSYDEVIKKYNEVKNSEDLLECPQYWGGFSFIPDYFEFWEGHDSRINKRLVFKKIDGSWTKLFLEP